jgi:hypothetical protein
MVFGAKLEAWESTQQSNQFPVHHYSNVNENGWGPVLWGGTLIVVWFLFSVFGKLLIEAAKRDFNFVVLEAALITIIPIAGVTLYLFRCRRPRSYASCEILVGLLSGSNIANDAFHTGINSEQLTLYFGALASLYIIVRGLDNWEKAIKDPKSKERWNRYFFGARRRPDKEPPKANQVANLTG